MRAISGRPRVLGIVPARGGSVGMPRKNLRPLNGAPLIAHAIRTAHECALLDRTIVSTDDDEVAAVAREYGADVPFRRPAALAQSASRIFDVLIHAIETVEAAGDPSYDNVVLLQPTSPLRVSGDVDACLKALWLSGADSVITVYRHPQIHPMLMYTLCSDGTAVPLWEPEDRMPQRQELSPVFIRTGLVYAFRRSLLRKGRDIYGRRTVAVQVPYERSVCIDDETDFAICEALFRGTGGRSQERVREVPERATVQVGRSR